MMTQKLKDFVNGHFAGLCILATIAAVFGEAVYPGTFLAIASWGLFGLFIGMPALLLLGWLTGLLR